MAGEKPRKHRIGQFGRNFVLVEGTEHPIFPLTSWRSSQLKSDVVTLHYIDLTGWVRSKNDRHLDLMGYSLGNFPTDRTEFASVMLMMLYNGIMSTFDLMTREDIDDYIAGRSETPGDRTVSGVILMAHSDASSSLGVINQDGYPPVAQLPREEQRFYGPTILNYLTTEAVYLDRLAKRHRRDPTKEEILSMRDGILRAALADYQAEIG